MSHCGSLHISSYQVMVYELCSNHNIIIRGLNTKQNFFKFAT
jgi:hypothetical protein